VKKDNSVSPKNRMDLIPSVQIIYLFLEPVPMHLIRAALFYIFFFYSPNRAHKYNVATELVEVVYIQFNNIVHNKSSPTNKQ
jgi:hypothetical protein